MEEKNKIEYQKESDITSLAIDTHAHLDRDTDTLAIIKNMNSDGLEYIIAMAGSKEGLIHAQGLASQNPNIYYCYGLHPYDIQNFDQEFINTVKKLKKEDHKFVGLGEFGLDYHGEFIETKEAQKKCFIEQLILANEVGLPISLHIRDAHEDALAILKEHKHLLKNSGIIHCFSGDREQAKEYLALGFYISFSGSLTFKKKNKPYELSEVAKIVPEDKLLIETDCPFLCPAPYRGQTNEPKYVLLVAREIAYLKDKDINEVIEITKRNAKRLFGIK